MAVLTLSREHQNGCVQIGRAVADHLQYDFVDRHKIFARLKLFGEKWGQMAEELHEQPPTLWEKYDRMYQAFIALVESTIFEFAAGNRAVILGRGSAFLLNDIPQVLKVRLYAPLELRIERRMRQEGEDRTTAEAYIKRSDKSRSNYVRSIYGKKLTKTSCYDLVYNTEIQAFDQVTRNLVEILEAWDRRATEEGWQRLKDRALAAKVKALILTHPEVYIPTLEVFPAGQEIVVQGVVHSAKELKMAREIVHHTIDSHRIRNELHYRKVNM
jgi:cytidylate kinase